MIFKRKKEVVRPIKIVFFQRGGIVSEYDFPRKDSNTHLHIDFPHGREVLSATIYFDWPRYEC